MNNKFGWEQLRCDFFYVVCVRVLGQYFSSFGFTEEKSNINGVIFNRGDVFIEVGYLPESAPMYSPTLIIGIGNHKYDNAGKANGLPAWSILPDNIDARNYSFWKFDSESKLETVLNKLRSDVIDRYIRSFWENRKKLELAIKNFG